MSLCNPVGSVYISVANTNPQTLFGGTWESFATGRTLVGVDASQDEFKTVMKIGGEKAHRLELNLKHLIQMDYP